MTNLGLHHIGIDFGGAHVRVSDTHADPVRQRCDPPQAVVLDREAWMPAAVLLAPEGDRVLAVGEAAFERWLSDPASGTLHADILARLGDDPAAERCLTHLAQYLHQQSLRAMNTRRLDPQATVTIVGVPAQWLDQAPERVALVTQTLAAAGFPQVTAMPDMLGVLHWHLFSAVLPLVAQSQRWLVIDMGARATRLAVLETEAAGIRPQLRLSDEYPVGGRELDQLFMDKLLLPRWQGALPTPAQSLALMRFAREFKEGLSDRLENNEAEFVRRSPFSQLPGEVRLSRHELEAPDFAGPLIGELEHWLQERLQQPDIGLSAIDGVVLAGGSARWYFLRERVNRVLDHSPARGNVMLVSREPALAAAHGSALALAGYQPRPAPAIVQELPSVILRAHSDPTVGSKVMIEAGPLAASALHSLDLVGIRRRARIMAFQYALVGTGIGLVACVPGTGRIILPFVEARLITNIGRLYEKPFSQAEALGILLATFVLGGVLGVTIELLLAPLIVAGIGLLIKAPIAGAIVYGLGELAIYYCERRTASEAAGGR